MSERTFEPRTENDKIFSSAAISAHETHKTPRTRKAPVRAATAAMVKVVCAEGSNKDTWKLSTLKDLREELQGKDPSEIIRCLDAVDVLTLGCRTNPIPVKDIDDHATFIDVAHYKGARKITEALRDDVITVPIATSTGKNAECRMFVDGRMCQLTKGRSQTISIEKSKIIGSTDRQRAGIRLEKNLRHQRSSEWGSEWNQ